MEVFELFQERFLENKIIAKAKREGKQSTLLELVYLKEVYQVIIHENFLVEPKRYHINDIQLAKLIQCADVIDLYENIFRVLPQFKAFCVGCQKPLDVKSETFATCGSQECNYKIEELPIDNKEVVDYVKKNMSITNIILMQALESASCQRKLQVFEPYPFFLLNQGKDEIVKRGDLTALQSKEVQDKINGMKNFDEIIKLLSLYKSFMKKVVVYNDDLDVMDEFGVSFYKLIKFILQSNKARVEVTSEVKNKYTIYKFIHEKDLVSKISSSSSFLFHGSSIENWYSILRNGLKVTSNTSLMTSGAAHGTGVYFSNDVNLSYSYCKMIGKNGFIGVYQLYDGLEKYKKTSQIYVVDNPNLVLLRYLIHLEAPLDHSSAASINKIFNEDMKVTTKPMGVGSSSGLARLLKEYKEIVKVQKENGFEVMIDDDDNMYKWTIKLTSFDSEYPIAQDMKNFKIKEVMMELLFPSTYPFNAPFVRIISPRFKYQTGHITSEGSICMELLTPSGWTPIQSIESLVIQIKSLIIEGDGRLDEKRWKENYSLEEAKKSFERVARGHGWLK